MVEEEMGCWVIFYSVLIHSILQTLVQVVDDCNTLQRSGTPLSHLCSPLHYFHNIQHLKKQSDIHFSEQSGTRAPFLLQCYVPHSTVCLKHPFSASVPPCITFTMYCALYSRWILTSVSSIEHPTQQLCPPLHYIYNILYDRL